ncbi:hypothetical protein WJX73_002136 [Symbiochloris irregularis]|uniref:BZIP domain-containing protein n=1 Tax=Symbiochloris irregularis TaxID=706552 RepID=A0AAW1NSM1_9CHLO
MQVGRQAGLDKGAISAVLGLVNDSVPNHLQRSALAASGAEQVDFSSILAASIGVPPGTAFGVQEDPGAAILSQLLPLNRPLRGRPSDLAESLPRALGDDDEAAESEEGSYEEGEGALKRKAPMTEEDRKRRRQEINRQSARRIRERRSHELETLKQQVGNLQHQQQLLLRQGMLAAVSL